MEKPQLRTAARMAAKGSTGRYTALVALAVSDGRIPSESSASATTAAYNDSTDSD